MAAIRHQVVSANNPPPLPINPRESYVDPLTQQKLRRETLGSCASGSLGLG